MTTATVGLDVERLARAMKTYYARGDGHIVPLGLRDKFGLPDIWPALAEGIAAEYDRLARDDDGSTVTHYEGD